MAVVTDHPVDDENVAPINGRPDIENPSFGVTLAKAYPPLVFSIRGVSCLVHRIQRVELHWWRVAGRGEKLVKLKQPVMIAVTHCAAAFRLNMRTCRTCHVPSPEALICGRCYGEPAIFPKHTGGRSRINGLTRQEAHVKLGCAVKGY